MRPIITHPRNLPLLLALALTSFVAQTHAAETNTAPQRWSHDRAWEWYIEQPWLCGFNYLPSTACNTTEWWQAETFDPETIDRELGWAEQIGYNTTRASNGSRSPA
jgi:hypothetical protein